MTAPCGCVNGSCKGYPAELCRRRRSTVADSSVSGIAPRDEHDPRVIVEPHEWACPACGACADKIRTAHGDDQARWAEGVTTFSIPAPPRIFVTCTNGHETEELRPLSIQYPAPMPGTSAAAWENLRERARELGDALVATLPRWLRR